MNQLEAVAVLKKAKAYFPSTPVDEDNAKAWAEALRPFDVLDGYEAVANLGAQPHELKDQMWIQTGAVVGEIKRMRSQRIADREWLLPPPPTEVTAYLEWRRATNKVLAERRLDKSKLPPAPELTSRPSAEVIRMIRRNHTIESESA